MSARRDHAITVLRTALQNGPVPATVLGQTLGLTHEAPTLPQIYV
jgi:hypothetical protein